MTSWLASSEGSIPQILDRCSAAQQKSNVCRMLIVNLISSLVILKLQDSMWTMLQLYRAAEIEPCKSSIYPNNLFSQKLIIKFYDYYKLSNDSEVITFVIL